MVEKVIYIHHSNLKAVVKFDLQQSRVFGIHSATQPPLHARRSPRIKQSQVTHDKSHLTICRKKQTFPRTLDIFTAGLLHSFQLAASSGTLGLLRWALQRLPNFRGIRLTSLLRFRWDGRPEFPALLKRGPDVTVIFSKRLVGGQRWAMLGWAESQCPPPCARNRDRVPSFEHMALTTEYLASTNIPMPLACPMNSRFVQPLHSTRHSQEFPCLRDYFDVANLSKPKYSQKHFYTSVCPLILNRGLHLLFFPLKSFHSSGTMRQPFSSKEQTCRPGMPGQAIYT